LSIWSHSYKESGLTFLKEKERIGRPSKFSATDKAKITALACSDSPDGHSQWSLRLLADKAVELELVETISYSTIGLVLKKRTSAAS
jgi:putative transposase